MTFISACALASEYRGRMCPSTSSDAWRRSFFSSSVKARGAHNCTPVGHSSLGGNTPTTV